MEVTADVSGRIRAFLLEEVVTDPVAEFDVDTPLMQGMVDSLGIMQLVAYVEEEFDVEIPVADITAATFQSIGTLSDLILALSAEPRELGDVV